MTPSVFGMDVTRIPIGDQTHVVSGVVTSFDHRQLESYAYHPSGTSKGLLVFFSGTPGGPGQYSDFMAEAAAQGYYVLGLDYINDHAAGNLCTCNHTCIDDLGTQLVEGEPKGFFDAFFPPSPTLPPGDSNQLYNSVNIRFGYFTQYLKKTADPTGIWDQFCKSWDAVDTSRCVLPDWSKIVVAGHSQGGYVASWILKHEHAAKALLFSAPTPRMNAGTTAQPMTIDPTLNSNTYSPAVCTPSDKPFDLYKAGYPAKNVRAFISAWDLRYKPQDGEPKRNWEPHEAHDIRGNLETIGLRETRVYPCTGTGATALPDPSTWNTAFTKWVTVMDPWNDDKAQRKDGTANHISTVGNSNGKVWCHNFGHGIAKNPNFRTQIWDWMLNN